MNATPMSLGATLAELAAGNPGRSAVTCGDHTISRAELESRTSRLARVYESLGVTADSFVTIGLPNGVEFVEATIAAWKAGATPQPISHRVPPGEREAILDLADPSLVVGLDSAEVGGRPALPAGYQPDLEDEEQLRHLRPRLAPYKLPRSFERVDHPLRDDAGKVRRAAQRAERLPGGRKVLSTNGRH